MAEEFVKLTYQGKDYQLPIIKGSIDDIGFDISKLRSETGLITVDYGYKNTGSTVSEITYLNGEKGELYYRGYPIEQLAEEASFTEVMYLLLNGELPNKEQLKEFDEGLTEYNYVSEEMKDILNGFPKSAHPMGVLSSLTGALVAFNPGAVDVEDEGQMNEAALRLLGKFPVLVSWTYRKKMALPLNYSDDTLNYVENFYQLMFKNPNKSFELNPIVVKALNKLLILHADHEQNCSASTVRIVGSSHAGLFASISAGISALWGPLHGGANQAVIEMLEQIKEDGGDVQKYIDKAKDKQDDFRLMGFGHRVYKNFDPRARIIKKSADEILDNLGVEDEVLDIAKALERAALEDEYFVKRKLYPNVDFYSGIIYRALGIPTDMFTVMFALGRLPGWISQWKELRQNNEPIGRPRQIYNGATKRDYKRIENR